MSMIHTESIIRLSKGLLKWWKGKRIKWKKENLETIDVRRIYYRIITINQFRKQRQQQTNKNYLDLDHVVSVVFCFFREIRKFIRWP